MTQFLEITGELWQVVAPHSWQDVLLYIGLAACAYGLYTACRIRR